MTVIIGFNLSDKLYIAADTRVSQKTDGEIIPKHDDLQKVEHLQGGIIVACAGDAGLARHVINRLRKQPFISVGIDATRRDIASWMGPTVDWYWRSRGSTEAYATFIIGGQSSKRRRTLDQARYDKMNEDIFNDEEARRQTLSMSGELFNGLREADGGDIQLKSNDLVLFSVSVDVVGGVKIEDTQWGECLVYGSPGLIKEDIKSSYIARLEFQQDAAAPLVTAYVGSMVEKRDLKGVGSAILVSCVKSNQSYISQGAIYTLKETPGGEHPFIPVELSNIKVINDVVHRIDNGVTHKLTPVSQYVSDGSAIL